MKALLVGEFRDGKIRITSYNVCYTKLLRLPGHRKGIDSLEETVLFYTGKLIQRAEKLASFPDELSVKRIIAYMYGETFPDPFVAYLT